MKAALPLLLVLLPIVAAGTNIYRCTDEWGNPLFSDLGCNSNEQLALTPLQPLEFASADRQLPQARAQDNAQGRRAALRRKQACTAATELITQIREKRRKGYDLGESARLRAQLNAAKDDRSRFCS